MREANHHLLQLSRSPTWELVADGNSETRLDRELRGDLKWRPRKTRSEGIPHGRLKMILEGRQEEVILIRGGIDTTGVEESEEQHPRALYIY